MTDSEINIAIARACGWKDRPDPFYTDKLAWTHDEGATWVSTCDLPDYCHDLNAMHEAESYLLNDPTLWGEYVRKVFWIQSESPIPAKDTMVGLSIHATARQRAEAFLRVKGLWRGEA